MAATKQAGADIWVYNNPKSYSPVMGTAKNDWQRIAKSSFEKYTVKSLMNKMKAANSSCWVSIFSTIFCEQRADDPLSDLGDLQILVKYSNRSLISVRTPTTGANSIF